MNKMIFALAALSVSATAAFAKLGEDLKQSSSRYGAPVGNDEVQKTVSFSKNGFFIVCHFNKDRACDSIIFSHIDAGSGMVVPLTPEEITALLTSNGNGQRWQQVGTPPSPDDFATEDGSIFAHYDRSSRALIFATKAYKDAAEAAQTAPQSAATPGM